MASKDTHVLSGIPNLEKSLLSSKQLRHNYFSLAWRVQSLEPMIRLAVIPSVFHSFQQPGTQFLYNIYIPKCLEIQPPDRKPLFYVFTPICHLMYIN